MKATPEKLFADILQAGERIQRFVESVEYEADAQNDLLQSAVERQFLIIGEALARLRRDFPDLYAQISDGPQIVGFRNVLVHGYDVIDPQIVWSAATVNLPQLLSEIQQLQKTG
ncbi:MAG: DUF86 domain-containing protein [Fimbriimonadales bacterium]|nr:DUF86 domain-containing protein [Fimbriimonadales bacterium]